jgi:hypothetical protein
MALQIGAGVTCDGHRGLRFAPALTNSVSTFVLSERMENVQVHTQWGILLSRVWVQ